jgi:hypothetical protein
MWTVGGMIVAGGGELVGVGCRNWSKTDLSCRDMTHPISFQVYFVQQYVSLTVRTHTVLIGKPYSLSFGGKPMYYDMPLETASRIEIYWAEVTQ